MDLLLLITLVLLVLLIEVTYLVLMLPRRQLRKLSRRPVLVDTSVLIDGRIVAVASSGFITDTLYIPRSVIGELQFLADNADHDKRSRARHGLDIVQELQNLQEVTVTILQDGSKAEEGVDERLLKLAKQYDGAICTIDYNLNKVAQVEGIVVLNVNELSQRLRMAYLPGEKMVIELVQKGQDAHQAVGYLSDGTMVVVERAHGDIGKKIEIEFIRALQTAAGKMMFAKKVSREPVKALTQKSSIVKHTKNIEKNLNPNHSDEIKDNKSTVQHNKHGNMRTNTQSSRRPISQAKHVNKSSQRRTSQRPTRIDRESSLIDLVERQ